MFCIRCGSDVPEAASFCQKCGNPIAQGEGAPIAEQPPAHEGPPQPRIVVEQRRGEAADVAGSVFRSFTGGFFGCLGVGVAVVVVIIIIAAAATCDNDDPNDPFDYRGPANESQRELTITEMPSDPAGLAEGLPREDDALLATTRHPSSDAAIQSEVNPQQSGLPRAESSRVVSAP